MSRMQQIIWGLDDNEKRQLYAIDLRTPGHRIITLPEDPEKAEVFRSAAKANQLICPDSSCRQPLIVKAGRKVRPHFAHQGGAGHSGEGVKHAFAKQIILEWVKQTYPKLLAEEEVTLENGRRADLLLTNPKTDKRMAIEVQYSAISDEEWLRRHRDYQAIGVYDLWLWGDTPPHCRLDSMCAKLLPELPDGQEHTQTPLKTSAVLELCQHETGSILFINPEKQVIGHAVSSSKMSDFKRIRQQHRALRPGRDLPASFSHISTHLIFDELGAFSFPLTDCKINPKGIETPLGVMLNEALGLKDELKAEARAKSEEKVAERERIDARAIQAAKEAEEERARQAKEGEERAERQRKKEQRIEEWKIKRAQKQLSNWEEYKPRVEGILGQDLPWPITDPEGGFDGIWMHHYHWRCVIWESLQGSVGQVLHFDDVIKPLLPTIPSSYYGLKKYRSEQSIRRAAIRYLRFLEYQNYLRLDPPAASSWAYKSVSQVGVCADLSFQPTIPEIEGDDKDGDPIPRIIDGKLMIVNNRSGRVEGPWPRNPHRGDTWPPAPELIGS